MKPSERIKQIREELVDEARKSSGNTAMPRERFAHQMAANWKADLAAIHRYLDERFEAAKGGANAKTEEKGKS